MTYRLTTILMKEGKLYTARCVEFGVVSQGKTIEDAQENLKEAVELYLENRPISKIVLPKTTPLITTFELNHA